MTLRKNNTKEIVLFSAYFGLLYEMYKWKKVFYHRILDIRSYGFGESIMHSLFCIKKTTD